MRLARLLLVLCCAVSLIAVAQEKKPAAPDKGKPAAADKQKKTAKPPAAMPAMKPSPEIQKMAKSLVGNYTTKETHDPGPFMPTGGTGVGEAKFTLGPGGNSIIESYQSKSGPMGSRFRGHGVVWYDAKAGGYRSVWCDSMSPMCEVGGVSKWDGDKLTGTTDSEMMGKKVSYRETMSGFSPEGFKMDMEMSVEGSPMKHVMTIEYARVGAAPAAAKPAAEKK
ncbi:MAG: DUF1579 domain-containing protein [Acidobacteriia bacterium]|nr:DUF1579 domain-containing protein [Terriglobia bacterium]